jgi:crotonobetainyl-CoA:carnitine CoA-transferase CaiB-like acyl-CoA transferase
LPEFDRGVLRAMTGPLAGLQVVDLSTTLTSATISGFLADFGADVITVEPPGGSPLRSQPAFPFWGRGKRSIALDLSASDDAAVARSLATRADVVIETFRPGVVERFGLGYDDLAPVNPRLVFASVTAFGRTGELAGAKGYEGLVMARLGGHDSMGVIIDRPGPAFCAVPYTAWSGAQSGLHGILAALVERERSGRGQRVDTTLIQGFAAHDTWNAMLGHIAKQYPQAFTQAGLADDGASVPNNSLFFRLLVALSADGRWLQFSQTTPRLFEAFMRVVGLDWMFDDPKWKTVPDFDDIDQRAEYYELLLAAVRAKTAAEWQDVFDREPDVWAEVFRHGSELLDHPQLQHDHAVLTVTDDALGSVRQPGAFVHLSTTPGVVDRPAPALDEHGDALRAEAAPAPSPVDAPLADAPLVDAPTTPPLEGVTVLELGTYYAAPYGATLLTDLGARVIKVEQLDGDPIRHIIPFPEVGGVKVLQGKESIAVDIHTDEGREIVYDLVRRADAILVSFRAGVVERLRLDPESLLTVNPDLVYLSAPGYGVDGPCGHRPAFAPTIGAGSGLAMRNIGESAPRGPNLDVDVVKPAALRVAQSAMGVGHADGFGALGVASALLLGLLGRARGAPGQALQTSMLRTMAHVLVEDMIEYDACPTRSTADIALHGLCARYRLYETGDGWVFLAAPATSEWDDLAAALAPHADLAGDPRFATEDARRSHDDALAAVLAEALRTRPADQWEADLLARDVGCLRVRRGAPDRQIFAEGGIGEEKGWITEVEHPVIGVHPRLAPLVDFSRSTTLVRPSALCGARTDAVLAELSYDTDRIDALRTAGVIL